MDRSMAAGVLFGAAVRRCRTLVWAACSPVDHRRERESSRESAASNLGGLTGEESQVEDDPGLLVLRCVDER
jgi:hypothetical protein